MVRQSKRMAWIWQLANEMPFYHHLGIELKKLERGRAEISLKVGTHLTQQAGIAHGGVTGAMVDSAVGLALCTLLKPHTLITTIELNVNYISPAKPGLLTASGRILKKGVRIAVGEAEVKDSHQALIAKGLVTYMILSNTS